MQALHERPFQIQAYAQAVAIRNEDYPGARVDLFSNRPEFSIPSEELVLTTNPALVNWMVIVVV